MDRNEPIFGWARKQHLQELNQGTKAQKPGKGTETIVEMLGIEDINHGIFKKKNNEYSLIVEADFVNYDLLSEDARTAIILRYSALYKVIRFPVQILGQAVTQDMRREEERFQSNLDKCNEKTSQYNNLIIQEIKEKTQDEFRISRKIYYVVSYVPETSRMGKLTPEDKANDIRDELYQRAWTIVQMLRGCDISAEILGSLKAMEVMKRALNRDRMVANPISDVAEREKLSSLYVTMDPTSFPGYDKLVYDVKEIQGYAENVSE